MSNTNVSTQNSTANSTKSLGNFDSSPPLIEQDTIRNNSTTKTNSTQSDTSESGFELEAHTPNGKNNSEKQAAMDQESKNEDLSTLFDRNASVSLTDEPSQSPLTNVELFSLANTEKVGPESNPISDSVDGEGRIWNSHILGSFYDAPENSQLGLSGIIFVVILVLVVVVWVFVRWHQIIRHGPRASITFKRKMFGRRRTSSESKSTEMRVMGTADFVPKLINCTGESILSTEQIQRISKHLPLYLSSRNWTMLYSTSVHGFHASTLLRRTKDKGPTVVVFVDTNGFVFGGFASESWKKGPNYFGTGESFVMRIYPEFDIYTWTSENSQFMICTCVLMLLLMLSLPPLFFLFFFFLLSLCLHSSV